MAIAENQCEPAILGRKSEQFDTELYCCRCQTEPAADVERRTTLAGPLAQFRPSKKKRV